MVKKRVWLSHIHISDFQVEIDDTEETNRQLKACHGEALRIHILGLEYGRMIKGLHGLEIIKEAEPRIIRREQDIYHPQANNVDNRFFNKVKKWLRLQSWYKVKN